jgi:uncharacterized protein YndB with AHSA1/START domain
MRGTCIHLMPRDLPGLPIASGRPPGELSPALHVDDVNAEYHAIAVPLDHAPVAGRWVNLTGEKTERESGRVLTPSGLCLPMPEPGTPTAAKPPVPHPAILGDAKITIDAPAFEVFAALTDQERLAAWWGRDALVEADEGGRYETTLPVGRVEGTITAIDGPQTLAFTWPLMAEGISVSTSVRYALSPRGDQTAVHVAHRAPKEVPGDWSTLWQAVLESLKAYVEGAPPSESP